MKCVKIQDTDVCKYVCMYSDTPIMISQFLIVLKLFSALFTYTVCVFSINFMVSVIPCNLPVKIKCTC